MLADSSVSTSDSDGDDSDLQSPLSTKAKIAHAHGGKSLKSGKEGNQAACERFFFREPSDSVLSRLPKTDVQV